MSDTPLASSWKTVLEEFYLGKLNHSVARDLEDGLLTAPLHSSSFSVAMELEKQISGSDKAVNDLKALKHKRPSVLQSAHGSGLFQLKHLLNKLHHGQWSAHPAAEKPNRTKGDRFIFSSSLLVY